MRYFFPRIYYYTLWNRIQHALFHRTEVLYCFKHRENEPFNERGQMECQLVFWRSGGLPIGRFRLFEKDLQQFIIIRHILDRQPCESEFHGKKFKRWNSQDSGLYEGTLKPGILWTITQYHYQIDLIISISKSPLADEIQSLVGATCSTYHYYSD